MNEYIAEGIMELLYLIAGGLVVGWVTSTFFARKAATAEVGGHIMKKKLAIYEELYKMLESFTDQEILPSDMMEANISLIESHGLKVTPVPQYPVMKIFSSSGKLTDTYLKTDSFISANRLYFNDTLFETMLMFTNYFAMFRRLLATYEQEIINEGGSLSDERIRIVEDGLALQLGLIYQDEFSDEINQVLYVLRKEVADLKPHKRSHKSVYTINSLNESDIMRKFMNKKIFMEREKTISLLADNIAMGLSTLQNDRV